MSAEAPYTRYGLVGNNSAARGRGDDCYCSAVASSEEIPPGCAVTPGIYEDT